MNLTSMLKLITVVGWTLGQLKPTTDQSKAMQKTMNVALLDIFAELLSQSNDPEFVCGVLAAGQDGEATPESEALLTEISEAITAAAEAENQGEDAKS